MELFVLVKIAAFCSCSMHSPSILDVWDRVVRLCNNMQALVHRIALECPLEQNKQHAELTRMVSASSLYGQAWCFGGWQILKHQVTQALRIA